MKRSIVVLLILIVISSILTGCGGSNYSTAGNSVDELLNTGYKEADDKGSAEGNDKVDEAEEITFKSIEAAKVPASYPSDKFPLSDNNRDKIMKIFSSSEDELFDLKVVSMRSAREFVEDYAALWELEGENTMIMDDLGSATLMGTACGYDIIVNGSDQSPDIPIGAKSFCAILIKKSDQ